MHMRARSLRRRGETGSDRRGFFDELERVMLGLTPESVQLSRSTGRGLADLLLAVAPPVPGGWLLDPACGFAEVLIVADERTKVAGRATNIRLVGRDRDDRAWLIAKARLGALGVQHQLGVPGTDSLLEDLGRDRYDTVIAEPGGKLWDAHRWLQRAVDWLHADGTAAVELPIVTADADRREAAVAEGHVSAIVVTPRRIRPETGERVAIWVLRKEHRGEVLVIDLSDQNRRLATNHPLQDDELDAVAVAVAAHHRGDSPGRELDGRLACWLVPLEVVRRFGALGVIAELPPLVASATTLDVPDVRSAAAEALGLARRLQELIGPEAAAAPTADHPLADVATNEAKRALGRLLKRLAELVGDDA